MGSLTRTSPVCAGLLTAACLLFGSGAHGIATAAAPWQARDLLPVTVRPAPVHAPLVLVENGQAQATLCIMAVPHSREIQVALQELQTCVELATGVRLPESRGTLVDGPAIVIGACPEAAAAGLDGAGMPVEGFAIKTAANRVFIVGHDDAARTAPGTAWGVFEFLERAVGVRWYWPPQSGGRSVPKAATLTVPPLWVEDAPVFRKREFGVPSGEFITQHTALRAGNSWPVNLVVHAPHHWGRLYGQAHPEVMQKRKDGSRDEQMLCYGNPKTLALHLEILARVFDKGERLQPGDLGIVGNAITVSPWDASLACYCDDCRRLWDPAAGGYGEASRLMGTFVASLGREVKTRWPDKTVIYLPYVNYTLAPTGIEFPDNVEVQLCGMPGLATYKEPAIRKLFQDNIDTWRQLTRRQVQTWDYCCWPEDRTKAPYLYPHVVRDYYRANRGTLVGTFINGLGDHWPRSHLSLYAWLKCLWNPDFDVDAAMDEFALRMFGPAAEPMRELVRLQCDGWEKSRWPDAQFSAKAVYTHSFPKPVIDRMRALLAEARAKIGDDPLLARRLAYYEAPFADFYAEYDVVIEGKGVRPLIAKKVGETPAIDGRLDEPAWAQATATTFRRNVQAGEEAEPGFPTMVKAVWTDEGVTFGFRCSEPDPDQLGTGNTSRDDASPYWAQDCLELFLEPSGTGGGKAVQLLLFVGGGFYDALDGDASWNSEGVQFAKAAGADFWSLEVHVPLKTLPGARPPGTGVTWSGQFARVRTKAGKTVDGMELSKMNAKYGGFNSNTADFAPIRFEE